MNIKEWLCETQTGIANTMVELGAKRVIVAVYVAMDDTGGVTSIARRGPLTEADGLEMGSLLLCTIERNSPQVFEITATEPTPEVTQ